MTAEHIIGFSLALFVMCVGLIGCVLPGLPGTPLILVAVVGHRLYFGAEASVGNVMLAVLFALTLLSLGLDYLATATGAKKFGATWRGMVGAAIGGVVGFFFSLPGIILGPFIGAVLFELIGGYKLRDAARAGLGAMLGLLFGALGKLALAVVMMVLFSASVIAAAA